MEDKPTHPMLYKKLPYQLAALTPTWTVIRTPPAMPNTGWLYIHHGRVYEQRTTPEKEKEKKLYKIRRRVEALFGRPRHVAFLTLQQHTSSRMHRVSQKKSESTIIHQYDSPPKLHTTLMISHSHEKKKKSETSSASTPQRYEPQGNCTRQ